MTTATPVDQELFCKAPTQDPRTRKHTGPRCSFRKVFDDTKPQEAKTIEELVADELCNGHKKMKDKFMHIIIPQLKLTQLRTAIQNAQAFNEQASTSHRAEEQPLATSTKTEGQITNTQRLMIQRVFKKIVAHTEEIALSLVGGLRLENRTTAAIKQIQELANATNKILDLSEDTTSANEVSQGGSAAIASALGDDEGKITESRGGSAMNVINEQDCVKEETDTAMDPWLTNWP
ncbi:MAG: hypothetical protein Q9213_005459 [Squamulea squamosa]